MYGNALHLKSEQPTTMWRNRKVKSKSCADPSDSAVVFLSTANLIADIDHHLFCQNLTMIWRSRGRGRGTGGGSRSRRVGHRSERADGAGEAINADGRNIIAECDHKERSRLFALKKCARAVLPHAPKRAPSGFSVVLKWRREMHFPCSFNRG